MLIIGNFIQFWMIKNKGHRVPLGILKKMAKVIIENLTLDYPLFNEGDFQLRNSIILF